MKLFKLGIITILYFISLNCVFCQDPVWPISATVTNYNQISTTFAEKHAAFHGAIDLFVANGNEYSAILDGKIFDDAAGGNPNAIDFMITHHDFTDEDDINSNLKKVRYGDVVDPLSGIENEDVIDSGQAIGEIVARGHLHLEMWIRGCIECDWYLVDPLNNLNLNYENLPPETTDVFGVEVNDIILEPQGNTSGVIFDSGNGLTSWHFNSCKIHKIDRADSQGDRHSFDSTPITVFGNILQTVHVRDTDVTDDTDITARGEGLGIYECNYYIDDELKYKIKFDEIEERYKPNYTTFFNEKYNTATGTDIRYGNHDYIKMHRLNTDRRTFAHKSFNDGIWRTRVKEGFVNTLTDIPLNANYIDGEHDLLYTVLDAADNIDDQENRIIVDNFQPFISRFQIKPNITGPLENEVIFEYVRIQSENGTALNDGLLINQSARIDNDNTVSDVQFNILMSEPMEEMSVRYRYEGEQYTEWNEMSTNSSNQLIWTFEIDDFVDGCILFNFKGEDKAGNDIINVFEETSSNTLGNNFFIPTRSGNNSWKNNPSSVGEDFFSTCTDCANLIELVADCDDIEDFVELSYMDCNGNYIVELNGIDEEFNIGWLNENEEYIAGGSVHPAIIGQNCYVIQDENGCCHFQGCIEVTGEERYADNFAYAFADGPADDKALSISTVGGDGLNYPITVNVIDATGNILCNRQIDSPADIPSCVGLIIGESYCVRYTESNGCTYENCFTTPGNSCTDPLILTVDNIQPECENSYDGAINFTVEGNPCERYAVKWSTDQVEIGSAGQNEFQLTGLQAGNYCVIIGGVKCEDCEATICFDVGNAPTNCDNNTPCEEILEKEILNKRIIVNAESIFFNYSTGVCEGGNITFDVSESEYDITVSLLSLVNEACLLDDSDIELDQNNPIGSFDIICNEDNLTQARKCAGTYCFEVSITDNPGCFVKICRRINYCEGKPADPKNIACIYKDDGGGQSSLAGAEETEPTKAVAIIGNDNLSLPILEESSIMLTKLFPNPFSTEINILLESKEVQQVEFILTDIYGRTVYQEVKEITEGVNELRINPNNNLASGVYALIIIDQHQKKYTQLITRINN